MLWQIDDHDAFCKEPEDVGRMIVGQAGSEVSLVFRRGKTRELVEVKLARSRIEKT